VILLRKTEEDVKKNFYCRIFYEIVKKRGLFGQI